MDYLAREKQTLAEHLLNTANYTKVFAETFGCANSGYITGLLHDLGKYTVAFQDYLDRSLQGEKVTRGEVIHALQGAKCINDKIKDPLIADIIGNIIASHHGGLFDTITDGDRTLLLKTDKGEELLHYEEVLKVSNPVINEEEIQTEILNVCRKCKDEKLKNIPFMLHLITKALYSCLVDADRCDAAGIIPDNTLPDWQRLVDRLRKYLKKFKNKTDLDKVRKRISDQCLIAGKERANGIYTLSVPTGGGKTLSSLRFALEHAKVHKMKRIIYVIPYLSILDQTASKMREVFKDDEEWILEHHSNLELEQNNDAEEEEYRLLTSRWDSPVILTTMVQFLETIYSNKASKLRKFHHMSEAVLIFDEIQALPVKCVHLFNEAVNFLKTFGKSTILLCTATQPHLHKTDRPVYMAEMPDIVNLTSEELYVFERVYIKDKTNPVLDYEQIAALVSDQIGQNKSTLVIMNTKSAARKVYEQCKPLQCEKAFLTTDLCPAHRLNVLERVRKNLAAETRRLTLCVSTQLIEAGVDISFDCVIRAEAGMDSIVQAAGRCNRNKENIELQSLIVIDVQGENLTRLREIKEGKDVTARVFRENKDKKLLSREVMNAFYRYYFYAQKKKMDYRVKNKKNTIYNLLSENTAGAVAYRNRNNKNYTGLPCAIKSAAEEFSVIDGGQTGIVVPYADALKLVGVFQESFDPKPYSHTDAGEEKMKPINLSYLDYLGDTENGKR